MINKFCEYFEGQFNNQKQAFQNPIRFAMIELIHEKIGDNLFRCTQQYLVDKQAYRKSVIKITEQDSNLLITNHKEEFDGNLTYQPGCDILFEYKAGEFHGKNICNDCMVTWSGKQTYLKTESVLGDGYYRVIDRGYDINTHEHIWGSFHGHFHFLKMPYKHCGDAAVL